MRNVEFERLNGDDDSNDSIKAQYKIKGYPTIIWTDNTGVALNRTYGFKTTDEFEQAIAQFQSAH